MELFTFKAPNGDILRVSPEIAILNGWEPTDEAPTHEAQPIQVKAPTKEQTQASFYASLVKEMMQGQSAFKVAKAGTSYPKLTGAVLSVAEEMGYEGTTEDASKAVLVKLGL